eukprot:SAG31_NODE_30198_length_384_cov_0.908772_1_plen_38_part_10
MPAALQGLALALAASAVAAASRPAVVAPSGPSRPSFAI